jgi:hypothetical protein
MHRSKKHIEKITKTSKGFLIAQKDAEKYCAKKILLPT